MDKSILRQAQQLQAKLARAQEELGNVMVEGTSGGGMVKVVVNGHQEVQSIEILPEVVDAQEVEMLQDMVLAAVNEAINKSREVAGKQIGSLTGGINIPGLM